MSRPLEPDPGHAGEGILRDATVYMPRQPPGYRGAFFFDPGQVPVSNSSKGDGKEMGNRKVRILVEGALAASLALALSYLRIWRMPQGGSITLENIPIFIFALRWGLKAGFGAGSVAGLLQLILGGYVVHPAQAILDYPLAFAVLALAAVWRSPLWGGLALGSAARFICHLLSGVVFFSAYAPEGTNVWAYSAVYNASFMLPSLVLSIAAMYILWPRLKNIS